MDHLNLANGYVLGLCIFSLLLYLYQRIFGLNKGQAETVGLKCWDIKPLDFGLIGWFGLMSMFLLPLFMAPQFFRYPVEDYVAYNAAVSALWTHVPVILAIYVLHAKTQLLGQFSARHQSFVGSAYSGFKAFIFTFPMLLVVSWVWMTFLGLLQQAGLPLNDSPQFYVQLIFEAELSFELALLIFAAVVLAPISEELIFRGLIYRFLRNRYSWFLAAVLSACLFALVHAHLYSFGPLFVLGLFLARSYEKSANISVPIFFHALFNLNSVLMILFSDPAAWQ